MDNSAAPWRVLDDPAPAGAGRESPGEPERAGGWLTLRLVVGLTAAAGLAAGAFLLAATGPAGSLEVGGGTMWASDNPAFNASGAVADGPELVVDVQGAVLRPGIQRLPRGSRVGDAIAAAGGFGPRVDAARASAELNLAAPVADGDRIVVPARGDPAAGSGGAAGDVSGGGGGGGSGDGLVDLNTASESELDELPGVGPVTVQKIVDARAEQPFASIDELRERKIVGEATFEKLRDLVTVR
jgi:competence protein ComEA